MALIITSLFTGLLFGLGLTISGMINPHKVLGFLDMAGNWDPSWLSPHPQACSVCDR
jgi:uncharacterized membrane protein YedE/YeeE